MSPLARIPRLGLSELPTHFGGLRLWVKCEDYTGLGFALIRAGRWTAGQDVVFIHTGGAPALFAYRHLFT